MNALNHGISAVFDALLAPLEWFGRGPALVIASGIFGVVALVFFKHLSWQKGIKAAKDKIKAHVIEIRLYQDDLGLVMRAIGKVSMRNVQYLALNLLPIVPLALPFTFVAAQFVVRYAFAPVPLTTDAVHVMPGQGTLLEIEMSETAKARVSELSIRYPTGVTAVSPLVRVPSEGRAFQEIVATTSGAYAIELALGHDVSETKLFVAGKESERHMQGERGQGFFSALLWPAEDTFDSSSPFARVRFAYPDGDLGWLPSGAGGVLITFLVASMLFGALAIKPLKVQI